MSDLFAQVIHGDHQWFTKKDVANAVAIPHDPSQDCATLVEACRRRHEEDPAFQYRVLTYSEYAQLQDANEYDHGATDMMAIMWQTGPQRLRAVASELGLMSLCGTRTSTHELMQDQIFLQ